MFLTILEQYLFFYLRPTFNNILVASSGFNYIPVDNHHNNQLKKSSIFFSIRIYYLQQYVLSYL